MKNWTNFHALAVIAAACGSLLNATVQPANAEMQGVDDNSIKIGMHTSQSGPISVFGLTYENVARLVFDEVNAAGGINGRTIDLIVEDDRGDPGAGVAAVTKLLDRDGVALIYGGPYTPVALAVFPRVVDRDTIYWSPAASTPTLTDPFNRLTFQAQMTLDDQAIPVAKLAASMSPTKIAFIRENNEYGSITHDAVVDELAKHDLKIDVEETIDPGAVGATAQIAKIKESGADVVLHGGTPKALSLIIREAHKQGLSAPIISFGGGSSNAIFELVTTEAPIEYYSVSPLACELGDTCTKEFLDKWTAKYPNDSPLVWTAQGYAAAKLFVEGLRRAGPDLTEEGLIEAFETMPEFSTPEIPYPMKFTDTNHRAVHGGYLDGFKDGKHYFFGDSLTN
jgi:branched-chain amino acid transport system substrate-binding protein